MINVVLQAYGAPADFPTRVSKDWGFLEGVQAQKGPGGLGLSKEGLSGPQDSVVGVGRGKEPTKGAVQAKNARATAPTQGVWVSINGQRQPGNICFWKPCKGLFLTEAAQY